LATTDLLPRPNVAYVAGTSSERTTVGSTTVEPTAAGTVQVLGVAGVGVGAAVAGSIEPARAMTVEETTAPAPVRMRGARV
jgi:hypothetical protein